MSASSVNIDPGTNPSVPVAIEQIGGKDYQYVKLDVGGDGATVPLGNLTGLPVDNKTLAPGAASDAILLGGNQQVQGNSPSAFADSGNPVKVGAVYRATPATILDGQRTDITTDQRQNLKVAILFQGQTVGPSPKSTNTDGTTVDSAANHMGVDAKTRLFNGTTFDRQRDVNGSAGTTGTGIAAAGILGFDGTNYQRVSTDTSGNTEVVGNVAASATDSGNPIKVGTKYSATQPTYTDGQRAELQVNSRGELKVAITQNGNSAAVGTVADAQSNAGVASRVMDYNQIFNGTSWDRQRDLPNANGGTGLGVVAAGMVGFDGAAYRAAQMDTAGKQLVTETNSAAILAKLPNQGQQLMAASQPVTIASDQTVGIIDQPLLTPTFAALTAGTTSGDIDVSRAGGVIVGLVSGASAGGVIAFEVSMTGGAGTWRAIPGTQTIAVAQGQSITTLTLAASTAYAYKFNVSGWLFFRMRITTTLAVAPTEIQVSRFQQAPDNNPTVQGAVQVANNPIVSVQPSLSSLGLTPYTNHALLALSQVKGTTARIYEYDFYNPNSTDAFVQMFNVASATTVTLGTTVPDKSIRLPAFGSRDWNSATSMNWSVGCKIAVTTTPTGATPVASAIDAYIGYL